MIWTSCTGQNFDLKDYQEKGANMCIPNHIYTESHFAWRRQFSRFSHKTQSCCHLLEHRCEAARRGCASSWFVFFFFFSWYKESLIAWRWCLTIDSSCATIAGWDPRVFKSGRLHCGRGAEAVAAAGGPALGRPGLSKLPKIPPMLLGVVAVSFFRVQKCSLKLKAFPKPVYVMCSYHRPLTERREKRLRLLIIEVPRGKCKSFEFT